ncbi:MAG: SpaA isopeptide-forming pilin-related protein [Ruminococcus flavefaciens]|nr:SpaA isopeptide-forming pilin-related protein [Ruminococcus flavefaciens]
MKHNIIKRAVALLLAVVCVMGVLPLSAFAAEGRSSAPSSITQKSSAYMTIGGQSVRYRAASSVINNVGLPYVFDEQVEVPGYGATRALCALQSGTLGPAANGQKWNFSEEVTHPSLKALLTCVYSHTYGDYTDAGNAVGLEHWNQYWSNIWFMVAQAMSWYYEHGILKDVTTDKEGFLEQASEEFVAAMKLYHQTYGQSSFITNWDAIDTHSIIDSADGGATGYSAYDYIAAGVNTVLEHPEYFHSYHLWIYDWDKSQPWKLAGQSGVPMQRLLIAVPDPEEPDIDTVQLTVKKLEAGTNKPLSGVTFTVKSADDSGDFSVTRQTGADGTLTLTKEADGLTAGQYLITEDAVPPGYVAQTASQLVTVLPGGSANSVFTFYNEPEKKDGDGSIRKVNADDPTEGIAGAVIRITSVLLDDGGSFTGEYITGEGGYVPKSELDFSQLPTGSYVAEEITPPEGFILSSDVAKVKQAFVWDGEHDVSLVFENSSKVKIQLKKVDESNNPLPGAIFVILRDGQVIGTEETQADGTITVSNVVEGYYEFREVHAPAGFDKDSTPVGVHVSAEDLQGEQTIVVTKMNHHKRSLTIQKRDTETGDPVPGTSFHIRGINNGYENDVVTGADGKATISDMPSGCYEIEETDVPKPYILDTNNRKTVWIDAEKDQDVMVDFVNSTRPGLRLLKIDQQTGDPLSGVQFRIREVNGSYNELHFTDQNGMIILEGLNPGAYTVQETKPKDGWVADDTIHTIYLEENKTTTIELNNLRKPDLYVKKVDSITGSPIANVKFQIWRGSDDTKTGEYNDLGTFYTDENGQIHLERVDTGWYKIKELEPAPGYTIKQPDTQEVYLAAGKDNTVTFENTPKNAIIVEKYDSVTHEALAGCTFQLRYLAGTSGTGGTVIGQKVTGANGIAMWTGLEPGAYVIEEVDPADGYSIINSSETVFLADNGEQSVVTVRFDNAPDGNLLIRKVCATNPSVTLQNAEFKITYSDGTFIGDGNGIYRTDENGEIRIDGLKPGKSVIATEVKAPAGFIIDTQSQTIQIKEGRTVSLTFKNQPRGKLIIQKRDSQTNEVLPGAEFRITTAAGCEVGLDGVIGTSTLTQNGIFTTDSQGEIRISNLAPGAYVINEIKAPDGGYVIDTPSTNVVIGQGGDTQTVIIKNTRKGGLVVEKYDSVTKQPLAGARFKIMMANGELTPDNEGLTSSNGLYTTDQNGQIVLSKLLPGTYVVSEDLAPENYRKDPTPQTVVVNAGDTQTLRFYDDPLCTLTILKRDAVTKKPLKGAEFLVRTSDGKVVGPDNGLYTTGTDGTVTVSGLTPNSTIVVSEKRAPTGYILDETPKNIVVRTGVANSLIFDNEPGTTLIIRKYIEGTENEPLSGVAFKVIDGAGAAVGPDDGVYYTDKAGEIVLEGIEPGTTVKVREIKTVEGYVLDGTPQDILIKGGEVQTLTFWNKRAGTLVIEKKDSVSGALISGAQFQLTYASGGYVDNDNGHLSSNGLYTTDDKGQIRIDGIVGTVVAKEVKAALGYVIDSSTQTQTVTVNPLDTQTLTFLNEPLG